MNTTTTNNNNSASATSRGDEPIDHDHDYNDDVIIVESASSPSPAKNRKRKRDETSGDEPEPKKKEKEETSERTEIQNFRTMMNVLELYEDVLQPGTLVDDERFKKVPRSIIIHLASSMFNMLKDREHKMQAAIKSRDMEKIKEAHDQNSNVDWSIATSLFSFDY